MLLNELCSFKRLKLQRFRGLGAARCVRVENVLIIQVLRVKSEVFLGFLSRVRESEKSENFRFSQVERVRKIGKNRHLKNV
jgi:hypothetical protein